MNYYHSIDTVPIWNFSKWQSNEDVRYFLKVEDYEELPEITDKEATQLTSTAIEIYFEANEFELKMSTRNNYVFTLTKRLALVTAEHDIINNILQLLELTGPEPESEKLLNQVGYSIREGKDFYDEIKRIFNQNQNKKVKINELRSELEALTKKTGESESIESIQIALEKHNNRAIDLHTTTLKKWLILKNNLIKDIEKQQLKKK